MPECVCCGKVTSFNDIEGYWQRWDFKRRWVCRECQDSGRYVRERPDERDLCWRHGLPMRAQGGCIQCEQEGY